MKKVKDVKVVKKSGFSRFLKTSELFFRYPHVLHYLHVERPHIERHVEIEVFLASVLVASRNACAACDSPPSRL